MALAAPTWADRPRLAANPAPAFDKAGKEVLIGIAVAAVAVVVIVAVLATRHKSQKITGCISSGANGMSVTDEKDNRSYALSGSTAGVKAGDRVTLEGKRKATGKVVTFEAHRVTKDFGACRP